MKQATAIAMTSVSRLLSTAPPMPEIFVYQDRKQLIAGACVHPMSTAYYDGAIHISAELNTNPAQSIIHEYVHHTLAVHGIDGPMWLHEGLAMHISGESWFHDPSLDLFTWIRKKPFPFAALVAAFPHTASPSQAMALYFQSAMMVRAIINLRGEAALAALVNALRSGRTTPHDAFSFALQAPAAEAERRITAAWARGDLLTLIVDLSTGTFLPSADE